jgi:hypothetical protein
MDLLETNVSRLRFESYIAELVSVIGHADRAVPLHDYCTGLLLPGERKSVEPMAALTAHARTAPKHQSLLHFVANAQWSDEAVLTKVRQMMLPKIEASIVTDSRRRASIRSGSRGNIAANAASRTIARRWCHCPSPTAMPACPSHTDPIYQGPGQMTRTSARKPRSQRTSFSRPNRQSHWINCAPRMPPGFHLARYWPMPVTAIMASSTPA